jgi:hypothetical protein
MLLEDEQQARQRVPLYVLDRLPLLITISWKGRMRSTADPLICGYRHVCEKKGSRLSICSLINSYRVSHSGLATRFLIDIRENYRSQLVVYG